MVSAPASDHPLCPFLSQEPASSRRLTERASTQNAEADAAQEGPHPSPRAAKSVSTQDAENAEQRPRRARKLWGGHDHSPHRHSPHAHDPHFPHSPHSHSPSTWQEDAITDLLASCDSWEGRRRLHARLGRQRSTRRLWGLFGGNINLAGHGAQIRQACSLSGRVGPGASGPPRGVQETCERLWVGCPAETRSGMRLGPSP